MVEPSPVPWGWIPTSSNPLPASCSLAEVVWGMEVCYWPTPALPGRGAAFSRLI